MEKIYIPLQVEDEKRAIKLVNALIQVCVNYFGLNEDITRNHFNHKRSVQHQDLNNRQYTNLFNQFKCFEVVGSGVIQRIWDGNREGWNSFHKGDESKCVGCVFYENCDLIRNVPKVKADQNVLPTVPRPLSIYQQLFTNYFPEVATIPDVNTFATWLENEELSETGYRLLHMSYSISDCSLSDFVKELQLPISTSTLNRRFKNYELETKPQGIQNPEYTFCDVVRFREDYMNGMSVDEIAKKYKIDTTDAMSYIHSLFDKYNMPSISQKEMASIRDQHNELYQQYHMLHGIYMSWTGTKEGFEHMYNVKWDSMLRFFRKYNYTGKARSKSSITPEANKTIKIYKKLHRRYLEWKGSIEEFETLFGVDWHNMRKWYTRKGFETRPKEASFEQKQRAQQYAELHEVYLYWPGNAEQFEEIYKVKWENMARWYSKNGYRTRGIKE